MLHQYVRLHSAGVKHTAASLHEMLAQSSFMHSGVSNTMFTAAEPHPVDRTMMQPICDASVSATAAGKTAVVTMTNEFHES